MVQEQPQKVENPQPNAVIDDDDDYYEDDQEVDDEEYRDDGFNEIQDGVDLQAEDGEI